MPIGGKTYDEMFTPEKKDVVIFTPLDFFYKLREIYSMAKGNKFGSLIYKCPTQIKEEDGLKPPFILFNIGRETRAQMGSATPMKPALRSVQADPNDPRQTISVFQMRYSFEIEISYWSANYDELWKISKEFKEFVEDYTGYLKELGIKEFIFQQEIPGIFQVNNWSVGLVSRTATYILQLDSVRHVNNQIIEQIKVQMKQED